MRDIKPLMLPKLAAVRNPQADSPTCDERYPDSSFSASECSTPLSQTFSTIDHVRHSSSLSSLSSSPPSSHEHLDSMTSSSKLPRLPEDPMEGPFASDLDDDEEIEGKLGSWCLCSTLPRATPVSSLANVVRCCGRLPARRQQDIDFNPQLSQPCFRVRRQPIRRRRRVQVPAPPPEVWRFPCKHCVACWRAIPISHAKVERSQDHLQLVQRDHARIHSVGWSFEPSFLNSWIRDASFCEHQPD